MPALAFARPQIRGVEIYLRLFQVNRNPISILDENGDQRVIRIYFVPRLVYLSQLRPRFGRVHHCGKLSRWCRGLDWQEPA